MANESAVESLAEIEVTVDCLGCGKDLHLAHEHLNVTVSPRVGVIERVDAALVGAETDEDGRITKLAVDVTEEDDEIAGSRDRYYLGFQQGEGYNGVFCNYECLAEWATKRSNDTKAQRGGRPKIKRLKVDPEAEGRVNE